MRNREREEILEHLESPSKQNAGDAGSVRPGVPLAAEREWPEPEPIEGALLPVQPLPLECLPKSLRGFIEDTGERMQVPMDIPVAAAIVALAGCVNRRAIIRPKKQDSSWEVVPNLWGAIVAPPGFMKSPVLRTVTLPLTHIEEMWRTEIHQAEQDYELAKEEMKLRLQAWYEQCKQAYKKGKTTPIRPDTSIKPPVQKRLVSTDATYEKLHEILSENPAGILVVRDELAGWVAELDKPGREGERGFYLQAWNGDSGFTVDRIGRGSIYVRSVCVSLLGNKHRIRGESLPPVLISHLAKYRSLMPSLAGLFELADLVADGVELDGEILISLGHARQAAAYCDYLESHAHRAYSCALVPERSAAISLLGHLKRSVFPGTFTTRDVYLKGWSGLNTPEEARAALGVLERHHYVARVNNEPTVVGGRPSEVWFCYPSPPSSPASRVHRCQASSSACTVQNHLPHASQWQEARVLQGSPTADSAWQTHSKFTDSV